MIKPLFIVFNLLVSCIAAHGQGAVNFNNRQIGFGLDAPILLANGQGVGTAFSAGLYYNDVLVPDSVTTFRGDVTSPNPALARYIVGKTVVLPGTEPQQLNVPVEMRVWLASYGSYEATPASMRGTSGELIIPQLAGGPDPTPNNNLPASFTGIIIQVPEPSIFAVGLLGVGIMLFCRRNRSPSN